MARGSGGRGHALGGRTGAQKALWEAADNGTIWQFGSSTTNDACKFGSDVTGPSRHLTGPDRRHSRQFGPRTPLTLFEWGEASEPRAEEKSTCHGKRGRPWTRSRVSSRNGSAGKRIWRNCAGAMKISRQTGNKWLERYQLRRRAWAGGKEPGTPASSSSDAAESQRCAGGTAGSTSRGRGSHAPIYNAGCPRFDGRAASSIGDLLRRKVCPSAPATQRTPPYTEPLKHAEAPNQVWCAGFKGWLLTWEWLTLRSAHGPPDLSGIVIQFPHAQSRSPSIRDCGRGFRQSVLPGDCNPASERIHELDHVRHQ